MEKGIIRFAHDPLKSEWEYQKQIPEIGIYFFTFIWKNSNCVLLFQIKIKNTPANAGVFLV
jgi:hypothetical protein